MSRRRPTRRDLLIVIGRLQGLADCIGIAATNDRHPDRAAEVRRWLAAHEQLSVAARSHDPPIEATGPWAKETDR